MIRIKELVDMGHDFGGYRVHLYHAIARYAAALQNDDFRERELAGEFLDTVLDVLIEAEVGRRLGPGPLRRAWLWLRERVAVIERIFHEGGA